MTQEQLGVRLQPRLKRGTISAIETAKQRVMAHHLAQIAEVLDVEASVFFPTRTARLPTRLHEELARSLPADVADTVSASIALHFDLSSAEKL